MQENVIVDIMPGLVNKSEICLFQTVRKSVTKGSIRPVSAQTTTTPSVEVILAGSNINPIPHTHTTTPDLSIISILLSATYTFY